MVKLQNEWHPKINVRKIADSAIKEIVQQKERFTGAQVKFIRTYLSMSLRGFAEKVVNESHTAVAKWEKCGNETVRMDINIERVIRLYVYLKVIKKPRRTKEAEFYDRLFEPEYISSRRHPRSLQLHL